MLALSHSLTMVSSLLQFSFLVEYFYSNNIYNVNLLTCFNDEMKTKLLLAMSNKGLSSGYSYPYSLELSDHRRGALLDITCKNSPSLLASLTKEKAFGAHTEWLLVNMANSSTGFLDNKGVQLLSNAYALPSSSVVLANILMGEGLVEYYDVYRISMYTNMKFLFLSRQPLSRFTLLTKNKRTDFDGVTFTAATSVLYPNIFEGFSEENLNHPEADAYAKVGYAIERNVGQQFNFSFTIKIFFNSYGYLKNGSFTHVMGLMVKEQIDFTTGLMMRDERMDYIDFAGNTFATYSPLIFKQPSLSSVSNIFLLPFEAQVWLATGALLFVSTIILFVEIIITSRLLFRTRYSFLEVFMGILEDAFLQGSTLQFESAAAKLTSLLFSIVSYFLFIAYSAKIVALLQLSTSSITSLSQLSNSHMAIAIQDVVYNRVYFQETKDPYVKEFYQKKIYPLGEKAYLPPKDGIMKIRSGFYAYKLETDWAYKLISETFNENEKCGLTEMNIFVLPMISPAFPKRSGLREHFSRSIIWQQETGIFQRIKKIFSSQKPSCNINAVGYTKVHLMDVQPALFFLIYGILGSILVFFLEFITTLKSFIATKKPLSVNF
ncbi:ionotropic receptor 75a [Halyomorpha halys]|uniref:ionotropic receptor 75a n=1 Tax=Halyomorpha halys TaxID=286706 RepID=UPI0034D32733